MSCLARVGMRVLPDTCALRTQHSTLLHASRTRVPGCRCSSRVRSAICRVDGHGARDGTDAPLKRPPPAPAPWLRLKPRWQARRAPGRVVWRANRSRALALALLCQTQAPTGEAMRGALAASLVSPAWRLLLLSDGSVTRHLQIVSGTQCSKLPTVCCACTCPRGFGSARANRLEFSHRCPLR